jgi:hypothetical protein
MPTFKRSVWTCAGRTGPLRAAWLDDLRAVSTGVEAVEDSVFAKKDVI